MRREELRNGNVIELENGDKYVYIDKKLYDKDMKMCDAYIIYNQFKLAICGCGLHNIIAVYSKPYALFNDEESPIWKYTKYSDIEIGTPVLVKENAEDIVERLAFFGGTISMGDIQKFIAYSAYDNANNTYFEENVYGHCELI